AKFLVIAPVLLLLGVGYTAAFWNSTSSAGFPAQAVKSVISSTEPTEKDRSSDQYRDMENFDINYTIRSAPVLGIGFGQKFYRPIPLPDISFFEFYEYIPHNSILWVWIKTGFGGFLSMLMMLGLAVRVGARNLVNARDHTDAAFALVGVAFVFMFAVFAYVDIAWNSQNMVLLAVAFALCSSKVARTAPRAASASVERPLTKAR
ncbi:MAG: O-antigen ligase domain-containing protein, partial [Acidimicrobiaceae bacterium]|nr:O-antigen ligase domain-containing protein [Acidimicrobiaceae bacterium]